MDLRGKRALVTGGARRVGAAITKALSEAGARVAIHCHDSIDAARELGAQCPGSVVVEADLADRAARDAIIPEISKVMGGLDILVNNAAVYETVSLPEMNDDHWDRTLEVNLTAPFFLARQAGRQMKAAGSGVIVNLTDWGLSRPYPDRLAYFAAKGALASVSMGLAKALAPEVRVVAVAPGAILGDPSMSAQQEAAARRANLLDRLGGPESVAESVLFAIRNDFLTGTTITVDGGRSLE